MSILDDIGEQTELLKVIGYILSALVMTVLVLLFIKYIQDYKDEERYHIGVLRSLGVLPKRMMIYSITKMTIPLLVSIILHILVTNILLSSFGIFPIPGTSLYLYIVSYQFEYSLISIIIYILVLCPFVIVTNRKLMNRPVDKIIRNII